MENYTNIIVDNSTKITNDLTYMLSEASTSDDVSVAYSDMISKILKKVDQNSFLPLVCNIIPMTGSECKIPTISLKYDDGVEATVNAGTMDKSTTGTHTASDGEDKSGDDSKFKLVVNNIDAIAKTRYGKTEFTTEFIQDLLSSYGLNGKVKLNNAIQSVITSHTDYEFVEFARRIATKNDVLDIGLTASSSTSIKESYFEIYAKVNKDIGIIGTETGTVGSYFVVASSDVCAGLSTIVLLKPIPGQRNNVVGTLPNGAVLIEDPYSSDNYFLTGMGGNEEYDNSGIIYSPYTIDFLEAIDADTFQKKLAVMMRHTFNRNKLDSKTTDDESDFFRETVVDNLV